MSKKTLVSLVSMVSILLLGATGAIVYNRRRVDVPKAIKEPIVANVSITPEATTTPSPTPSTKKTKEPLIDCTGPDGKKTQVTKSDCDNLNLYWGKQAKPSTTPSSNNSNTTPSNQPSTTNATITPVVTTTPTPVPNATFSTNTVNLTINRGETKNNLFTITSNGATGFTTTNNFSPSISNISYNPGSAGMQSGQTLDFSLTVPSNAAVGSYTGSIKFTFTPGNYEKTVTFNLNVTDPPANSMSFTFSADSINVTVPNNGSENNVFTFTSSKTSSYSFNITFNDPKPAGGGIGYLSSGGAVAGQTHQQYIQVYQNVTPGNYTGTGTFRDGSSGAEKTFPVSITVTN